MSAKPPFPHVVIRASAGTGKTYQLAVRFIGLLAGGARPDEILATTFTRKAAGEILDRVLFWLAEAAADETSRQQLAAELKTKSLSAQKCRDLLLATVRRLHSLRIGTLDSHFLQIAGSFGHELGLPPGWSICDELIDAVLRDEAIELVLSRGRTSDLLTLVHSLTKGTATRSVARLVRETVGGLFELFREAPSAAWEQLRVCKGLAPEELEAVVAALAACELPAGQLAKTRDKDLEKTRLGDWDGLIAAGLASKVLCGDGVFNRKPLPPDVVAHYKLLLKHAESILVGQIARQTEATHQLLTRFAEHYYALQLEERALRFSDVTLRLAGAAEIVGIDRMAFRLDGGIRHVLLDEFQDTAPAQWRVLRPLAQNVAGDGGGSFFCVGDAKQAIYGWRGGMAELFDALDHEITGLTSLSLDVSRRSAQPVIDAVNAVFQHLTSHPHLDKLAEPVASWQNAFPFHTTARTELAGHVSLATAPAAVEGEDQTDIVFRVTAEQIRDLVSSAQRASVGVLVRTNAAVARLIYLLRELGVPASEEGGNPLVDSPAVELILSLLRLADHPGDRVARFHLATSPLASLVEITDHRDDVVAMRTGQRLRRQLMDDGYGAAIAAWTRALAPSCDERDANRLQQLVELAYEYQPASTLRTSDFIRLVETRRIADPTSADVRVMTIHQAKGLQFDAVFLPELNANLAGQRQMFVAGRPAPTEPVNMVCRLANEHVRQFFPPALNKLFDDDTRREVTEALCVLYVAMTRAVHALYMILPPARPNEKTLPKTYGGLLRAALAPAQPAAGDQILYEHGDPNWFRSMWEGEAPPEPDLAGKSAARREPRPPAEQIRFAPLRERRHRNLERTSPSALEGGAKLSAAMAIARRAEAGFNLGTLFHAWLQQIAWLDDGLPSDELLRRVAQRLYREIGDVSAHLDKLIARFRKQLAAAPIAAVLSRSFYGRPENLGLDYTGKTELVVYRERPFATRDGDAIVAGNIDRLVVISREGRPIAADVLDFKTDDIASGDATALAAKIAFYRPQLEAYRCAAARIVGIEPKLVSARLVLLVPGLVETVV